MNFERGIPNEKQLRQNACRELKEQFEVDRYLLP